MGSLYIKNWTRLQHLRAKKPKWIKLYVDIDRDVNFVGMTDIDQYHLIRIWILAARNMGEIPDDPLKLKRILGLRRKPDLDALVEVGFLMREPCEEYLKWRAMIATLDDTRAAEQDAEEEENIKKVPRKKATPPYATIVNAWNEMAQQNGLPTAQALTASRRSNINSRWEDKFWRENWEKALRLIPLSAFHTGKKADSSGQTWRATFAWFIRPDSVVKMIENNGYQDSGSNGHSREALSPQARRDAEERERLLGKQTEIGQ